MMRNLFCYFLIVMLLGAVSQTSFADDMDKKTKKRIKGQLKEYMKNPESYQAMIDSYKKKIDKLEKEVKEAEKDLKDCQVRQVELEDTVSVLMTQVKPAEPVSTESEGGEGGMMPTTTGPLPPGASFAVQMGAFEFFNITEYFKTNKIFTYETEGKANKYIVRYFTDINEAERFADDIRKLGIKGAFVVNYLNGKRISPEEMEDYLKNQAADGQ